MKLFFYELKANVRPTLVWSGTMVFLIYAGMMKYGAFEKTGESVNEIFSQMPPFLLKILGMDAGGDLTSVAVFYSIFYLYFILLTAVHALMTGAIIIGKEERDKTAEFLLVKPITRLQIVSQKLAAAMVHILILNLVTLFVSWVAVAPYSKGVDYFSDIVFVCMGLGLVQLLFFGLGSCLGGAIHRSKTATGIGGGIILATFMLKVLIDLNKDLADIKVLTPFSYFSGNDLMLKNDLDTGLAVVCVVAGLVLMVIGYWRYQMRDIH